ncbi:MAG TPA: ATP-binding protein [Gemmatimonadaceae bacterium]|nr:ATP-binding protein [Gemmatimonadaceae bacterium]
MDKNTAPTAQQDVIRSIVASARRPAPDGSVMARAGSRVEPARATTASALIVGSDRVARESAAAAIAKELGVPLHRVDLSGVVSKYIGETEKNLSRVFEAAERAGAVLFFDEADALFGKRTDVKDAHDRYANIEVSYLLTRLESHSGLSILATNRKSNIDDAFTRRMRHVLELPD